MRSWQWRLAAAAPAATGRVLRLPRVLAAPFGWLSAIEAVAILAIVGVTALSVLNAHHLHKAAPRQLETRAAPPQLARGEMVGPTIPSERGRPKEVLHGVEMMRTLERARGSRRETRYGGQLQRADEIRDATGARVLKPDQALPGPPTPTILARAEESASSPTDSKADGSVEPPRLASGDRDIANNPTDQFSVEPVVQRATSLKPARIASKRPIIATSATRRSSEEVPSPKRKIKLPVTAAVAAAPARPQKHVPAPKRQAGTAALKHETATHPPAAGEARSTMLAARAPHQRGQNGSAIKFATAPADISPGELVLRRLRGAT